MVDHGKTIEEESPRKGSAIAVAEVLPSEVALLGRPAPVIHDDCVYAELWVSLASLLRSYTAAHGLNGDRQATVELGENKIMVRHAEKWLALDRDGASIAWKRENGSEGELELTAHGRLRAPASDGEPATEEEMDMAAEAWARELMWEPKR